MNFLKSIKRIKFTMYKGLIINLAFLISFSFIVFSGKAQALVTMNPYDYYNKLKYNYLYNRLIYHAETLSKDQLAFAQINTLGNFYYHAFRKENFYDFKNILKFLKNCNCEDYKNLIKEFDKWYILYGAETFRNGYTSEHSRKQIGELTLKYQRQDSEVIDEFIRNWFFNQDFFIQPNGLPYDLGNRGSRYKYFIPYINDFEEYKFNQIGNLVPIKNFIFSSSGVNFFYNDSINEQSIFVYSYAGFLKHKVIAQVKDKKLFKTTFNYNNIKIKEVSSDKLEERFYHANGRLSFSLPYGIEIESVIGFDSEGKVSYKDGNGAIYKILSTDDVNISYTRIYKNFKKISEKEYFGDKLIKSREFTDNVETTRKSHHWKNGLVIKEEPSDIAEEINLYQNHPKSEEINVEQVFIRIIPDDLLNGNLEYPISSPKFEPAKLLNEMEIIQLVKKFINDPNSARTISEAPILEFKLEAPLNLNNIDQSTDYTDLQSQFTHSIKISPAKYNGNVIHIPIKLYITALLK